MPPQMITHLLGGEVKAATHGGEYGRMPMDISKSSQLFSFMTEKEVNVWMSHGDEAVHLPEGFSVVAKSRQVRHNRISERRELLLFPLSIHCLLPLSFVI